MRTGRGHLPSRPFQRARWPDANTGGPGVRSTRRPGPDVRRRTAVMALVPAPPPPGIPPEGRRAAGRWCLCPAVHSRWPDDSSIAETFGPAVGPDFGMDECQPPCRSAWPPATRPVRPVARAGRGGEGDGTPLPTPRLSLGRCRRPRGSRAALCCAASQPARWPPVSTRAEPRRRPSHYRRLRRGSLHRARRGRRHRPRLRRPHPRRRRRPATRPRSAGRSAGC